MQAFEREDAEAASPAAERVILEIDGAGVPMAAREVEGVAGKQADGTAKTREAKAVTSFTADGRDPKTRQRDQRCGAAVSDSSPASRTAPAKEFPTGSAAELSRAGGDLACSMPSIARTRL